MDSNRIEQLIAALRDDNEGLGDHAMASLGQMGVDAVPQLTGLMAVEDVGHPRSGRHGSSPDRSRSV
ncbi:MAG: hypothetical protein U0361_15510 [Nitrospiraceae bacterium]